MKIVSFLIATLIVSYASSKECLVDNEIMSAIAHVEAHNKREVGYPYLISFNNKRDSALVREKAKELFIDSRTMDCQNKNMCASILNILVESNIKNLDIGAFQLNYKFWKLASEDYFIFENNYNKACSIVSYHNRNEWTWKNIAKFHSKTKKYNTKYQRILKKKFIVNRSKM